MRKALLALGMVALLAGSALAQTGSVTGLVVDAFDNPVEGAKVSVWQDGVCLTNVLTDASGAFTITDLAAGTYMLKAGKPKVGTVIVASIEVIDGETLDVGTLTLVGKEQAAPGKWGTYR